MDRIPVETSSKNLSDSMDPVGIVVDLESDQPNVEPNKPGFFSRFKVLPFYKGVFSALIKRKEDNSGAVIDAIEKTCKSLNDRERRELANAVDNYVAKTSESTDKELSEFYVNFYQYQVLLKFDKPFRL